MTNKKGQKSLLFWYNISIKNDTYQHKYHSINQLELPLNLAIKINKTDPVFTFNELVNNLDLTKYLNRERVYYSGRKGYDTVDLLKLVLFGYMIGKRSLRDLEDSCKNDIRFMWLGHEVKPSHQTFATFINNYQTDSIEDIFYELNKIIIKEEQITFDTLFIDGTKLEANANKYSFVWKNAFISFCRKMVRKIKELVNEINNELFFFKMFFINYLKK